MLRFGFLFACYYWSGLLICCVVIVVLLADGCCLQFVLCFAGCVDCWVCVCGLFHVFVVCSLLGLLLVNSCI